MEETHPAAAAAVVVVVERYHLVMATWAAAAGLVFAAATRFVPAPVQRRLVGLAGLTGAVVGGAGSPRAMPWLVAAGAVVLWGDDPTRPHPLGEWAAPLTVVSLVGVWASVPDAEPALAAGAALGPLALVLALERRSVGPAGTAALAVAVLGSVWVGSAGWGAALANVCAIGVVAAAPAVVGFRRVTLSAARWCVVVGAQLTIALPLTRVIMRRSAPIAVLMAAAGLAAAVLVIITLVRQPRLWGSGQAQPSK